jgi:hypothetical protein
MERFGREERGNSWWGEAPERPENSRGGSGCDSTFRQRRRCACRAVPLTCQPNMGIVAYRIGERTAEGGGG